MAKHYNLSATLQTRDKGGKPVTYTPADNPQPLPDALAREAVERGLATEVTALATANRRSASAPTPPPVPEEEGQGAGEDAGDQQDA